MKIFSFSDETFKRSLAKLREDILRANGLVREANNFAEELGQQTRFSVTLQIPPQNLSPNRKVINLPSRRKNRPTFQRN